MKSSRHWIKYWPRMLDDIDIVELPPELWRLLSDVFLVLGQDDPDLTGITPTARRMQLILRHYDSESTVESMMDSLSDRIDTVERYGDRWRVPNWKRLQLSKAQYYKEKNGETEPESHGESTVESTTESTVESTVDSQSDHQREQIEQRVQIDTDRRERERAREKARPDSVETVAAYMAEWCQEKRHHANTPLASQKFFNHFESNGWKVGKARAPMKDWRGAARNWILDDIKNANTPRQTGGLDRRSSQERGNQLTTADIAPALSGALRLLGQSRGPKG